MQNAVAEGEGGMLAVLGSTVEIIEDVAINFGAKINKNKFLGTLFDYGWLSIVVCLVMDGWLGCTLFGYSLGRLGSVLPPVPVCVSCRSRASTHFAVKRQGHVLTFRFGSVADSGGSPCSSSLQRLADRSAPREGRAPKHSEAVASTSDASALGMWLQLGRRSE